MKNNNLLKKMLLALVICAAVPCANAQTAHVGDILCEGDLIVSPANYNANAHTAKAVVFYVDNTGQHGWAVALQDAGSYGWGCHGSDMPIPNYGSKRQAIYDLDGYENTRVVRERCSGNTAFYAVDFANGWYVPAIGQLNYLYGNLGEVNATLVKIGGTPFVGGWEYWSSTEYSSLTAWFLSSSGELHNYYSYNLNKLLSRRVRGVRAF
ncbi:MAG: hypothetical protein IJQ11_06535 [Bacteroidales bacterium]|nr:hypothetical protein [Bacteroidales bacterium]